MSKYEVVYPLGRRVRRRQARAERPRSLDNITIGELSNDMFDAGFVFESIEKAILKRVPTAKFVSHEHFGDVHGPNDAQIIRDLPDNLKRLGVDVVISGVAG